MKTYKAIYFLIVIIACTFRIYFLEAVAILLSVFNLIDVLMKIHSEWKMRRNTYKRIKESQLKEKQNAKA